MATTVFDVPTFSVVLAAQALGLVHLVALIPIILWSIQKRWTLHTAAAILLSVAWVWKVDHDVSRATGPTRCALQVLQVASANLRWDNPDPAQAIINLTSSQADIVVTVETSFQARQLMVSKNWYVEVDGLNSQGPEIVIWGTGSNRLSVVERNRVELPGWSLPYLTVDIDGELVTVVGVHLKSPMGPATRLWADQLRELTRWVDTHPRRVVLAGDFNASIHHSQFQPLLNRTADSERPSHRLWNATWPTVWPVAMLDLDHILVDRALATCHTNPVRLPGSDHRGIVASVGLTPNEVSS